MTRKKDGGTERVIEPAVGATYRPRFEGEVACYEYGWYDRGVLKGRRSRTWLDSGTLDEMRAKFPEATVAVGSGYVEDSFSDLPDEDDLETYEREQLRREGGL